MNNGVSEAEKCFPNKDIPLRGTIYLGGVQWFSSWLIILFSFCVCVCMFIPTPDFGKKVLPWFQMFYSGAENVWKQASTLANLSAQIINTHINLVFKPRLKFKGRKPAVLVKIPMYKLIAAEFSFKY